ncbi:MAG: hypothetical protein PUP93_30200 [Rhizonema sp. NSF051]|nr:hypothetical protein [Rhizonema sp. NSF051]
MSRKKKDIVKQTVTIRIHPEVIELLGVKGNNSVIVETAMRMLSRDPVIWQLFLAELKLVM